MIRRDEIRFEFEGQLYKCAAYRDDARRGQRPGVLLFPHAYGLDDESCANAERLAAEGFHVLASDLHGDGSVLDDPSEVAVRLENLGANPERLRAQARAALDALCRLDGVDAARTAALGYCFGGTMALELARSGVPIRAAVGLHSGLATQLPAAAGSLAAKILVCIGADDPLIPPGQRDAFIAEMSHAGADWRMHLYGGVVHSFTSRNAESRGGAHIVRYDDGADRRSWREMLALFDEAFAN